MEELLRRYIADNAELDRILILHSRAVRDLALHIALEKKLSVDLDFVAEAAMLHDIGVVQCDALGIYCFGKEQYIKHGILGATILRSEGLPRHALVAERHTGSGIAAAEVISQSLPLPVADYIPVSLEEKLICYADKFYSKNRDLLAPKPLERIREQMRKHGGEVAARFERLVELFGDPFA